MLRPSRLVPVASSSTNIGFTPHTAEDAVFEGLRLLDRVGERSQRGACRHTVGAGLRKAGFFAQSIYVHEKPAV